MARLSSFRMIWVSCFAGTVALVVATAIPVLGLLLVILGAPLLPTLLLNIAFVAMALDGLFTRVWVILVPPLLWFGGYTLVAAISHVQVASLRDAAATANANAPVRWNRSTQSVRIDKIGTSSENLASDITPQMLVTNYGLDEVYGTYRPEVAYRSSAGPTPQRVALDHKSCPEGGITVPTSYQYHRISRGGYPNNAPMQWAEGVCLIFQNDASPPASPLVVALAPAHRFSGLVDGISQDITISGPDQEVRTFRAVQVAPLPWVPMPIIGCGYKGGFGDTFDNNCHAEFHFTSWRGQDEATPVAVVARAVGLTALAIEQRLEGVAWK
jgi:hypothetical protein